MKIKYWKPKILEKWTPSNDYLFEKKTNKTLNSIKILAICGLCHCELKEKNKN